MASLSPINWDGLDVSQNVYTQSPVEMRLPAVNILEQSLNGAETDQKLLEISANY